MLRGGAKGPNYDSVTIALVEKELAKNKLAGQHHGRLQPRQLEQGPEPAAAGDAATCAHQIVEGNQSIVGVMLESNIHAGNQSIPADLKQLKYGVSVTDACIDWPTTEKLLRDARAKLKDALPARLPQDRGSAEPARLKACVTSVAGHPAAQLPGRNARRPARRLAHGRLQRLPHHRAGVLRHVHRLLARRRLAVRDALRP